MVMFSATKLQVATYLLGVCPFSIAFLVFLNSSVSFVITDLIGKHEGVGNAVGSLGFADELVALIACPAWGLLSDRIGVRYVCVCGYLIIALALALFVQAHNVYPQLLLGRLLFSLGGAAASTMVTAVLPTVSSAASKSQHENAPPAAQAIPDRSHTAPPSIESELTITPDRFRSTRSQQPKSTMSTENDAYISTSRVAGFVGMFTGCGALIALLLFLPLPAKFQGRGMAPDQALKHSFYIVAGIAFLLALWSFFGLRKLTYESNIQSETPQGNQSLKDQARLIWRNLKVAILAGFERSDIALGYLGGFVARASSVGISLFIPLLINRLFDSSHLCLPAESIMEAPVGLPDLKRKCPQAYIVAAAMTGACETVALIAAPIFGYAASRTSRKGLPMMIASAAGVVGYCLFPALFDPDGAKTAKRAGAFGAVSLIGISQIGSIVCSLGVLGSGILATSRDEGSSYETTDGADEENAALLGSLGVSKKESKSLAQLKGSVAGIYSFYGGGAILLLTKLGGSLFDTLSVGAPFYIMAVFNGILFVACAFLGWRKSVVTS